MYLVGSPGQTVPAPMFDASGTITVGGTAQLIVPRHISRTSFLFENISDTNMFLEIGGARAAATLTNNAVTSVAVTNSGFGYSMPPSVIFYGGGNNNEGINNSSYLSAGQPGYPSPANRASAHCVMTGSAPNMSVSSIVIDNGGSGYVNAPYVFLQNRRNDPFGAATPSATVGILIVPNGSYTNNGVSCTTDAISVFCASSSKAFTFKWMP